MYSSDLLHLQHIACEESNNEQHNRDEERPCREQFLLSRVTLWRSSSVFLVVNCLFSNGKTHPQDRSLHRSLALCSIRQSHVAELESGSIGDE